MKENKRQNAIEYPANPQGNTVETIHGIQIPDPYRWLENFPSKKTQDWVNSQNTVFFNYIARIPLREAIRQRVTDLCSHAKYGIPFRCGNRYFFSYNNGMQDQNTLCYAESLADKPSVFLDPNSSSRDGTVALTGVSASRDGAYLAYGVSTAGSDWQEWKIRSVTSGHDLEDHLKWIKFGSIVWSRDSEGFFYNCFEEPAKEREYKSLNCCEKLYYHRLGTAQSEDELVFKRPHPEEWGFSSNITSDGHYLIISVKVGGECTSEIFYKDLHLSNSKVIKIISEPNRDFAYIGSDSSILFFKTNLDAPNLRVIAVDILRPQRQYWKEIVSENKDVLQGVLLCNHKLVMVYLHRVQSQVKILDMTGTVLQELQLPGIGTVTGLSGCENPPEVFYGFSGFLTPERIYKYDPETGHSFLLWKPQIDFNANAYKTEQVFYRSNDGTQIPMSICYKKGLKRDGNNPTYLYGYGGFSHSLTPAFSVANLVWIEMGGVYAQANLRGGGEYGEFWHKAGMKSNKQNVFDDFIAAAEWLMKKKYTNPSKLAIGGRSNGGLLVGACITQRPDLFAACLLLVGVLDMLRFHKFTIGWTSIFEYGSPEKPEEFRRLLAYSPYYNIQAKSTYPATLIMTGDHDDRVFPAHSFKFAAALQKAQAGASPVLIQTESRTGHGTGKSTSKSIEEITNSLTFLVWNLGMEIELDHPFRSS